VSFCCSHVGKPNERLTPSTGTDSSLVVPTLEQSGVPIVSAAKILEGDPQRALESLDGSTQMAIENPDRIPHIQRT